MVSALRFLDRAFGIALLSFGIGALIGAPAALLPGLREFVIVILRVRVTSPLQVVSELGRIAVVLLIFLNNSITVVLSFLYPFVMMKIRWTPPMSKERMQFFMGGFTVLASFLIGFFNLGAILATVWVLRGESGFLSLLSSAWIHGPLEFTFVLLCVAEPLRSAWTNRTQFPGDDLKVLWVSLLGLLASAAVEVFLGI